MHQLLGHVFSGRHRAQVVEGSGNGEHHAGELRQETAEAKGERIIAEELVRLGWPEKDLVARRKSDPDKLAIASRLRRETTLSIQAIAVRVRMGTSKSAKARLHEAMRDRSASDPNHGRLGK